MLLGAKFDRRVTSTEFFNDLPVDRLQAFKRDNLYIAKASHSAANGKNLLRSTEQFFNYTDPVKPPIVQPKSARGALITSVGQGGRVDLRSARECRAAKADIYNSLSTTFKFNF